MIKFENKNYATFDKHGKRINFARKQEVMIVKTQNGEIYANYYTNFYTLVEVEKSAFKEQNIYKKILTLEKNKNCK